MRLEGYGIVLERLKEDDIELVRQMRNSDHVRNYMEYRNIISTEQQQKWFASINNEYNNYFLIISNGVKCGLISGADIDWEQRVTRNGGLFIWDEKYQGTSVPVAASLLLTHLSFLIGFRMTYIRTLKSNQRAVSYNTQFGYVLEPGQESVDNQLYSLTAERFLDSTRGIRKALAGGQSVFRCVLEEPLDAMSLRIRDAINTLLPAERSQIELIIQPSA